MAKKTVITKLRDVNTQSNVIEFPQNRTLYADQFTDEGPISDEDRAGFAASSMKEVFGHYKPNKNVDLTTEGGGTKEENFKFSSLKDFEDEQLIANSELLSAEQGKIDAYNAVIQQLEKNRTLQKAIKDESSRDDLKNALKALLAEIEDSEK